MVEREMHEVARERRGVKLREREERHEV